MPIVPVTQEAEAGESLEPVRQRLQLAEITSLYFSLGNKEEGAKKSVGVKRRRHYANGKRRLECILQD